MQSEQKEAGDFGHFVEFHTAFSGSFLFGKKDAQTGRRHGGIAPETSKMRKGYHLYNTAQLLHRCFKNACNTTKTGISRIPVCGIRVKGMTFLPDERAFGTAIPAPGVPAGVCCGGLNRKRKKQTEERKILTKNGGLHLTNPEILNILLVVVCRGRSLRARAQP